MTPTAMPIAMAIPRDLRMAALLPKSCKDFAPNRSEGASKLVEGGSSGGRRRIVLASAAVSAKRALPAHLRYLDKDRTDFDRGQLRAELRGVLIPWRAACCPATGQVVAEAARPTCRVFGWNQIGRPKPYAQRRVRARHDRSHRQSGVTAALAAAQDARTICEAERLSRRLTMGANEPVAPASLLQVAGTGRIVREKSLELWQRLWEPKIATLVNVHEHGRTLPLVAVGDNRIGKVETKKATAAQEILEHHGHSKVDATRCAQSAG